MSTVSMLIANDNHNRIKNINNNNVNHIKK